MEECRRENRKEKGVENRTVKRTEGNSIKDAAAKAKRRDKGAKKWTMDRRSSEARREEKGRGRSRKKGTRVEGVGGKKLREDGMRGRGK